jgi:hypothetical protein
MTAKPIISGLAEAAGVESPAPPNERLAEPMPTIVLG